MVQVFHIFTYRKTHFRIHFKNMDCPFNNVQVNLNILKLSLLLKQVLSLNLYVSFIFVEKYAKKVANCLLLL